MTTSRLPDTTEANVRMSFWLETFGTFPTYDALREIREYRQSNAPTWKRASA